MGKLVFFVAASQSFGRELFYSSAVTPKGKDTVAATVEISFPSRLVLTDRMVPVA